MTAGTMILLPTYNERENIEHLLPLIFSVLPDIRIMVVDDASPDGSALLVETLQKKFPNLLLFKRPKKEGLGRAYADAFKKVLQEFPDIDTIVTMDADFSHGPKDLPGMLALRATHDLVIGSRYVEGGNIQGWEFSRRLLSAWGNRYARIVTHLPIRDATSGFTAIATTALKRITFSTLNPSGYAFTIALKYALWKSGARIKEYPITFRSRRLGESKISLRIISEGVLLPWKLLWASSSDEK